MGISISRGGRGTGTGGTSVSVSATSTGPLGAGQVCRITTAGQATPAQADAFANCVNVSGLAATDTAANTASLLEFTDLTLVDWTAATGAVDLVPGPPYYLSDANPGQMTQTPPFAAGSLCVRLGFASSARNFVIQIAPPIQL